MSSEIRAVDFGEQEWFDAMSASTVRLASGQGRRAADTVAPGGVSWRMLGPPAYADADGDGDEDAAVGLHAGGGQMFSFAWYVWLWQDGAPVQIRVPIASVSRCEGPIDAVTATAQGFQVRMLITARGADTCAGGGSVPVTYVVGVRDGWPVRVAPEFGPIATCNPQDQTLPLSGLGTLQLKAGPDHRAPAVEPSARYRTVFVDPLAVSPDLTDEQRGEWILVTAVARDAERGVCGWALADQIMRR